MIQQLLTTMDADMVVKLVAIVLLLLAFISNLSKSFGCTWKPIIYIANHTYLLNGFVLGLIISHFFIFN